MQHEHFDAVISSGLGGGSLIYANVLLRKDEKWFVREEERDGYEYWPDTRADLDPHYDAVEAMMNTQRYPFEQVPYSDTPKTNALKEAAEVRDVSSSSALPLLGMGRDRPTGRMSLGRGSEGRDGLDVDWRLKDFERVRTMQAIAHAWRAKFMMNPTWLLRRVVTVHPLGGCPMGRHREEGVVDAHGEVFGHPCPVGPNTVLTIAALADCFAERIIHETRRHQPVLEDAD